MPWLSTGNAQFAVKENDAIPSLIVSVSCHIANESSKLPRPKAEPPVSNTMLISFWDATKPNGESVGREEGRQTKRSDKQF
jgi:hypothetical protein